MNKINTKVIQWIICLAPALVFLVINCPQGVEKNGWILLGIFISTILGFILKPAPISQIALLSLTVAALFKIVSFQEAFSGFANTTTWLIVSVFFIAQGVINTGLSNRIAYIFVKAFGKNVLGLTYSMVVTDFIMSPFIPTAGAKTGSIVVPVINSITESVDHKRSENAKALKEFLLMLYSQITAINNAIFLFATSSSAIAYSVCKSLSINITWFGWFTASIVPGAISLIVLPFVIFKFYAKRMGNSFAFQQSAEVKLKQMGKFTSQEFLTSAILIFLLLLWMNSENFKLNVTVTAFLGLNLMLFGKIITLKDIISNTSAWNTLIWFGVIIMFSESLQKYNVLFYLSQNLANMLTGLNWEIALLTLSIVYFYAHYLFAGGATHVTSLYSIFLTIALSFGAPALFCALTLSFVSNLFNSLTHYASVSSAILFEQSTQSVRNWCMQSLFFSSITLSIWIVIGTIWWKAIKLF